MGPGPRQSHLHSWHEAQKAQLVVDGESVVPFCYGKVDTEYIAMRQRAVLIDLSHRGLFRVEGEDALAFLEPLLTRSIVGLGLNQTTSAFMLNSRAGIVDGFTIYRENDYCMLIGSGRGHRETMRWLEQKQAESKSRVRVFNLNADEGHFALLGPQALNLLQRFIGGNVSLEPGEGGVYTVGLAPLLVIRRNSGRFEGYHLITASLHIQNMWTRLTEVLRGIGAVVAGLGAMEVLRVETGQARLGSEIDQDTTPIEVSEQRNVDFEKRQFVGRRALMHSTGNEYARSLALLQIRQPFKVARGAEVLFDRTPVGRVTTVVVSPTVKGTLALGYVMALKNVPGTHLKVQSVDGRMLDADVVPPLSRDYLLR